MEEGGAGGQERKRAKGWVFLLSNRLCLVYVQRCKVYKMLFIGLPFPGGVRIDSPSQRLGCRVKRRNKMKSPPENPVV